MSSLTKHLTTPSPHGQLPFDSRCPVCCDERLHGKISVEPIVPTRVKASLATALVTMSAAATPTASIAQEADQEIEGTELPRPDHRDPDPGSEAQVPGDESVPAPGTSGGDETDDADGPPLGSEPEVNREPEASPEPQGGPPSEGETPRAPGPPAPAAESNPAPEADTRAGHPASRETAGEKAERPDAKPEPDRGRAPERQASGVADGEEAGAPLQPPTTLSGSEEGGSSPRPSASSEPPAGSRLHVVQPGESLWSIAAGLGGPNATPAKIARIVNRLWTLNADRIGTGNPDLVMAGTTLRLP